MKLLFALYFRILKNPRRTLLLAPALRGISKFAHLVNIDFNAQKTEIGRIVQNYFFRESDRQGARFNHSFGSIFASGKLVVFASVGGKVFVWDKVTGIAEYEMNHGGGECMITSC